MGTGTAFIICQLNEDIGRDIHGYIDIYLDPVVVVLTFVLGYYVSNSINKKQEVRRLKRVYHIFEMYYTKQVKSINKQIETIREHIGKVKELQDTRGLDIVMINQPYYILESVRKEDVFSAWVDIFKKDPKLFFEIMDFFVLSRDSFEMYLEYHKGFLLRQNNIRLRWNSTISEFHTLKTTLTNAPIQDLKKNPDLMKLNEIYNVWIDSEKSTAFIDVVNYISEPIKLYYTPIYERDPNNQVALQLLKSSQAIKIIYSEWQQEIFTYRDYLDSLLQSLSNKMKETL